MTPTQVFSVVNSLNSQLTGGSDIKAADLSLVIDVGKIVTSNSHQTEQWFKILWDRIGKTIITQRSYTPQGKDTIMNAFEYGTMLQKLYIAPTDASDNVSWDALDGDLYTVHVVKPKVTQQIFQVRDVWECDTSIPDIQLKGSFVSAEAMAAFIDGIMLMLEQSMGLCVESLNNAAYLTAICTALGTVREVNLTTLYDTYVTAVGGTKSYPDFLRFSASVISKYSKHMTSLSKLYNAGDCLRHTPTEYQRLTVLSDFASDMDMFLQSDVWHNELTKMPYFNTTNYWQGVKETEGVTDGPFMVAAGGKLPARSAINVTHSGAQVVTSHSGSTFTANVVATLGDVQTIGLMFDNMRTRSVYDSRHELTAIYAKADKGYYVDPSENFVVFTVSAPEA